MDGTLVAENPNDNLIGSFDFGIDLWFGIYDNKNSIYAYKGLMDEIAIYNEILTPDEISQHYQNGLAGEGYCQP